jgi:hypothetical protein
VVPPALRTAFYLIRSAPTGFTTSDFLSRNRVSPKEAFEGLERGERKLSWAQFLEGGRSNPVRLLGYRELLAIRFSPADLNEAAFTADAFAYHVSAAYVEG